MTRAHAGSGDAFGYVEWAQTIIDTGRLPPLGVQPRGYSMLIAPLVFVSGDGLARWVLVINAIMDCSVVAILFRSASYIFPLARQRRVRGAVRSAGRRGLIGGESDADRSRSDAIARPAGRENPLAAVRDRKPAGLLEDGLQRQKGQRPAKASCRRPEE